MPSRPRRAALPLAFTVLIGLALAGGVEGNNGDFCLDLRRVAAMETGRSEGASPAAKAAYLAERRRRTFGAKGVPGGGRSSIQDGEINNNNNYNK